MNMSLETLFRLPDSEVDRLLGGYESRLKRACPLPSRFRAGLPTEIRLLSEMLTSRRSDLGPDYARTPGATAAYLRYFLPWNLYRLALLLPKLSLDIPDKGMCIDAGAGPLTLVQALWIARPDLRERQISFHCLDRSPALMRKGMALFHEIAGERPPWKIRMVHGPQEKELQGVRGKADAVFSLNVLNEQRGRRGEPLESQVAGWIRPLLAKLKPEGRALFVEPATRQGGRLISLTRKAALARGDYVPLSPCPHLGSCPMLAPEASSWCHFTHNTQTAPSWLRDLSRRAGLPKEEAGFSFVFLGPASEVDIPQDSVRVLSNPFAVPDKGMGRYGCSEKGLVILYTDAHTGEGLHPGALLQVVFPQDPVRDFKSGALEIDLRGSDGHASINK